MIHRLIAATAVAGVTLIAASSASLAADDTTRPPIAISTCGMLQFSPNRGEFRNGYNYENSTPAVHDNDNVATSGVEITFRNRTHRVARRVVFAMDYRGVERDVVDVGKFSPHATIDHYFDSFSGLSYLGAQPNACAVKSVIYADGTLWRNPEIPFAHS